MDGGGIPLATILTDGNRHDITQLVPLVDAIPPVRGKAGRPRRRPESVYGDRAYSSDLHRRETHVAAEDFSTLLNVLADAKDRWRADPIPVNVAVLGSSPLRARLAEVESPRSACTGEGREA